MRLAKFKQGMHLLLLKHPKWSKQRAYRRMKELAALEKRGIKIDLDKL
jgi:nuclear transport factor 2 (NTF2) superfamily protein